MSEERFQHHKCRNVYISSSELKTSQVILSKKATKTLHFSGADLSLEHQRLNRHRTNQLFPKGTKCLEKALISLSKPKPEATDGSRCSVNSFSQG
mmetsp:Transcript_50496/g.107561  ORF Transcript_50496/g.107561 Transcript_50496/m.107561 type:complete len:95 (+) Transcript_50496:464-748(+)